MQNTPFLINDAFVDGGRGVWLKNGDGKYSKFAGYLTRLEPRVDKQTLALSPVGKAVINGTEVPSTTAPQVGGRRSM